MAAVFSGMDKALLLEELFSIWIPAFAGMTGREPALLAVT